MLLNDIIRTMKNPVYLPVLFFALLHSGRLPAQPFAAGSGTAADPYRIATPAQLDAIRGDYLSRHYELTADLDFSGYGYASPGKGWLPIGRDADNGNSVFDGIPFSGTFNGKGHVVLNLFIDRPDEDHVGLFGRLEGSAARIDSLGVERAVIRGRNHAGMLSGFVQSGSVARSYVSGQLTGGNYMGGLSGGGTGAYSECHSAGEVSGNQTVGGLLGALEAGGQVSDSYSLSGVSGHSHTGGLVGRNAGVIFRTYSSGEVRGAGAGVGGLVGVLTGEGRVTEGYWNTTVSGQTSSAGGQGLTTTEMYHLDMSSLPIVPGPYNGAPVDPVALGFTDSRPNIYRPFGPEYYYEIRRYVPVGTLIDKLEAPSDDQAYRFSIEPTQELFWTKLRQVRMHALRSARVRREVLPVVSRFPFAVSDDGRLSVSEELDHPDTRSCYPFLVRATGETDGAVHWYLMTIDVAPRTPPRSVSWRHRFPGVKEETENVPKQGFLADIPSACMGRFSKMTHVFSSGNAPFEYHATHPYKEDTSTSETLRRYRVDAPYYHLQGNRGGPFGWHQVPYHITIDDRWYALRNDADAIADAPLNHNKYITGGNLWQKTEPDAFTLRIGNTDAPGRSQEIDFTILPTEEAVARAQECEGIAEPFAAWNCRYNSEVLPGPPLATTEAMRNSLPNGLFLDRSAYDLRASMEFNGGFDELHNYFNALDADNFDANAAGTVEVQDGKLRWHQLRFIRDDDGSCRTLKGRHLKTNNLFEMTHGYFEVRFTHFDFTSDNEHGNFIFYSTHRAHNVPYDVFQTFVTPGSPKPTVRLEDVARFGDWEVDFLERWDPGVRHSFVRHYRTNEGRFKGKYTFINEYRRSPYSYVKYWNNSSPDPGAAFTVGFEWAPGHGVRVFRDGSRITRIVNNGLGFPIHPVRFPLSMSHIDYIKVYYDAENVAIVTDENFSRFSNEACDNTYGLIEIDYMRLFTPRNGY